MALEENHADGAAVPGVQVAPAEAASETPEGGPGAADSREADKSKNATDADVSLVGAGISFTAADISIPAISFPTLPAMTVVIPDSPVGSYLESASASASASSTPTLTLTPGWSTSPLGSQSPGLGQTPHSIASPGTSQSPSPSPSPSQSQLQGQGEGRGEGQSQGQSQGQGQPSGQTPGFLRPERLVSIGATISGLEPDNKVQVAASGSASPVVCQLNVAPLAALPLDTLEFGSPGTLLYRMLFFDSSQQPISPLDNIPLFADGTARDGSASWQITLPLARPSGRPDAGSAGWSPSAAAAAATAAAHAAGTHSGDAPAAASSAAGAGAQAAAAAQTESGAGSSTGRAKLGGTAAGRSAASGAEGPPLLVNCVYTTPRGTWARFQVAPDEPLHPLRPQKTAASWPERFAENSQWNHGVLPQTWADADFASAAFGGLPFAAQPLEVIDVERTRVRATGECAAVKPLGALLVVDRRRSALSWLVLCIAAGSAAAARIADLDDLRVLMPGTLEAVKSWLLSRESLEPGDHDNVFGLNGRAASLAETHQLLQQGHATWHQQYVDRGAADLDVDVRGTSYRELWECYTCHEPSDRSIPLADSSKGSTVKYEKAWADLDELQLDPARVRTTPLISPRTEALPAGGSPGQTRAAAAAAAASPSAAAAKTKKQKLLKFLMAPFKGGAGGHQDSLSTSPPASSSLSPTYAAAVYDLALPGGGGGGRKKTKSPLHGRRRSMEIIRPADVDLLFHDNDDDDARGDNGNSHNEKARAAAATAAAKEAKPRQRRLSRRALMEADPGAPTLAKVPAGETKEGSPRKGGRRASLDSGWGGGTGAAASSGKGSSTSGAVFSSSTKGSSTTASASASANVSVGVVGGNVSGRTAGKGDAPAAGHAVSSGSSSGSAAAAAATSAGMPAKVGRRASLELPDGSSSLSSGALPSSSKSRSGSSSRSPVGGDTSAWEEFHGLTKKPGQLGVSPKTAKTPAKVSKAPTNPKSPGGTQASPGAEGAAKLPRMFGHSHSLPVTAGPSDKVPAMFGRSESTPEGSFVRTVSGSGKGKSQRSLAQGVPANAGQVQPLPRATAGALGRAGRSVVSMSEPLMHARSLPEAANLTALKPSPPATSLAPGLSATSAASSATSHTSSCSAILAERRKLQAQSARAANKSLPPGTTSSYLDIPRFVVAPTPAPSKGGGITKHKSKTPPGSSRGEGRLTYGSLKVPPKTQAASNEDSRAKRTGMVQHPLPARRHFAPDDMALGSSARFRHAGATRASSSADPLSRAHAPLLVSMSGPLQSSACEWGLYDGLPPVITLPPLTIHEEALKDEPCEPSSKNKPKSPRLRAIKHFLGVGSP